MLIARYQHSVLLAVCAVLMGVAFVGTPAQAQITRFAPEDVRSGDFGYPMDVSSDGTVVLVGDIQDDIDGNNNQGSAYLFQQQSDGSYAQGQKLVVDDEADEPFGEYLALSGDGQTAFVRIATARLVGFFERDVGVVYVFADDGSGTYVEQQQIASEEEQGFGEALATTDDGRLLAIGAPQLGLSGTNAVGAVYIYERQTDGSYTQIQQIEASDANTRGTFGDFFGSSVALSGDGATLLIGAINDGFGSVYVLERGSNGLYTEAQKIEVAERPNDYQFGSPIALSADGSTVFIGTDEGQGNPPGPRQAFVYVRDPDGTYVQRQVFEPNGAQASRDAFGTAVAVSDDGDELLAGAPLFNTAYYYTRQSDGTYTLQVDLDDSGLDPGLVRFGQAVALRGDGELALVGVPGSEPTADDTPRGSVYVFPNETLPVELTRFEGTTDGDAVHLEWQTASETNNAGFAIERASGEEASFTEVAFVNGAGTTPEPQRYTFRDATLPFDATHVRYRLRQTDTDGTTALSDVVRVTRRTESAELKPLFPNPTTGTATIRYTLPSATNVQVAVFDLLGRRVATIASGREAAGRIEQTLDARGLAPGTYVVRLQANGQQHTRRFVVVH